VAVDAGVLDRQIGAVGIVVVMRAVGLARHRQAVCNSMNL
jgi:hypothetical protein